MARHPAYGTDHKRVRRALLASLRQAGAGICPLCSLPITADMPLDLHHSDSRAKLAGLPGDTLVHRACNQYAGGLDGKARQMANYAARNGVSGEIARNPCTHGPARQPPSPLCYERHQCQCQCDRLHATVCERCGQVTDWARIWGGSCDQPRSLA